ncbi:MAG: RidA family protein [Gammaproteobacteria bacterium]
MIRWWMSLIMLLSIAGCQPMETKMSVRDEPEVEFLSSPGAAEGSLPFSEAVRVGNLLFLSGMIGNVPGTLDLAPGGIQGETRQALQNIQAALERHGSAMDRVVKCTVFLADMAEWSSMNEVYVQFFPGSKPARSAFGASGLALDSRVEIECIATVGASQTR